MSTPPIGAGSRPQADGALHQIGLLPLVFVFYGYTTGGPFAYEAIFSLSGPGMATLFLTFVPLFWSIPISLVAAELNSLYPVQGGFYRWSREAFGDFWGFQTGWWNWTGTFLLSASYGVAFVDYIGPYVGRLLAPLLGPGLGAELVSYTGVWRWLGAMAFLSLMAYANIRGIEVAGWVATALQVAILAPVTWLCLAALLQWEHNPMAPLVPPGQPVTSVFGAGLALALWNYAGYEQLSSVAQEVRDVQRTFLRALAWTTPLAVLTYTIPCGLALAALGNWQEWKTGYLVTAAERIGGPALGVAMLVASIIAIASLSNSTVLSTSRVPYAMAEDGFLPAGLGALHPRYRTPRNAIVFSLVVCGALVVTNVVQLIAIYIWTRIATSVLTVLAAWRLRRVRPDAPRGFRIPGGGWGLGYVVIAPLVLCGVGVWYSDPIAVRYSPWLLASGPVAYLLLRRGFRGSAAARPTGAS